MDNILNNNENKEIFLKAIILGINYGKSINANYYLENIEKELLKLNEKNVKINNNENFFLLKYVNNIINLENQKKDIINLINNLSSKNYTYNYTKINYFKNNLILIDLEIKKNKIFLKKIKDNKNLQNNNKSKNDINNIINDNINNNIENYKL